MPKKEVESTRKSKRPINSGNSATNLEPTLSDSVASEDEAVENGGSPHRGSKSAGKRSCSAISANDPSIQMDFTGDLSKILESFGADINKTLVAKRRRLENYTQESIRATAKKVLETTKNQGTERKKLIDEFRRRMAAFIEQGESELEKSKEAEEKIQKLMMQQHKHQQQMRTSQNNRLKSLKALGDEFFKGLEDLESHHQQQYSLVNNELRKEMSMLQKKILMETQQQEMLNVRKSLQTMLM